MDVWDADPSPGNETAALTSIASLDRIDPNNPYAEIYLAVFERITGKVPEAVARLEKVLTRSDLSPSARAWALRQQALGTRATQPSQALAELEEALALDPTNSNTYASLGLVLGRLGRQTEALTRSEQAVMLNPMNWRHRAAPWGSVSWTSAGSRKRRGPSRSRARRATIRIRVPSWR